jgi:hypothetical protein
MSILHDKILLMTEAREYPKTICPSEVARALSREELNTLQCADWRAAMDPIRREAWSMRQQRLLDITQKGEVVRLESLGEVRGPIRLRKVAEGIKEDES